MVGLRARFGRTMSDTMKDYRKLLVWQKAHDVALRIHTTTDSIRARGNLGLINQIRRAALSIPANIAEGCGRSSDADFAKFVQIAIGSVGEVEYHLHFASDRGLLPAAEVAARHGELVEVRKMLIGLQRKLRPPTQ